MTLRNLSGRHSRVLTLANHEEDILVERRIDTLSYVLDIRKQGGNIEFHVNGTSHKSCAPRVIGVNNPAWDQRGLLVPHVRGRYHRRIRQHRNRLGLVVLLLL